MREVRVALLDVGHLAGVELDVGAADADALDVDEQLARGAATGSGTSSTAAWRGAVTTSARISSPRSDRR